MRRHVAQSVGFQVLDIESMAAQLPKESMMADITHPEGDFLLQVTNPPFSPCKTKPLSCILMCFCMRHKVRFLPRTHKCGKLKYVYQKPDENLSPACISQGSGISD